MSFIKLCKDDSLLQILRETFSANPIKIPEERIKPLVVLSKTKVNTYLGTIEDLLIAGPPINLQEHDSLMADVSATSSKSVSADLGLKIMDGFLKGFGSNTGSIKTSFSDTLEVSFSFENVYRKYIDLTALTKNIKDRKFDPENGIVKSFIDGNAQCLVITSVITSNRFTIKKESIKGNSVEFDINAINGLLSSDNNKIKASSASKLEISFEGEKQLAFAYTASILEIDVDGSIYYSTEPDKSFLTTVPEEVQSDGFLPAHFLEEEIGLSEIEFN